MKKVSILFLALFSITVVAQEKVKKEIAKDEKTVKTVKVKKPKTMKTASGLEYTITEKGNGKRPQIGDKVKVHYTGKLLNDTVFDSSVKRGQPFEFKLGAGQVIKGWDEAFQLLDVGDKATIKLPADIAYGNRAMGSIPPNSTLIFDVELIDFKEGVRPWDAKGKDTITTASGLKYIIIKENKAGEQVKAGAQATVHYSGYFKDGKMFDSSVERGQPFKVKVGKGQVIKGWDEGLALLRKGEKAKLFIPYQLGYGEQGYGPIPAKAELIFDVEIVDVQEAMVPVLYDVSKLEAKKTASGLSYYEVKRSGSTVKAEAGKTVKVHYSGYLADGKMFDSSIERGEPIEFPLGQGMVIPGWEEGIALMNVGDKLRLVIPYYLAYGEQGREPIIPAKADLTFDVELVDVK
ncbi:MAG: FKBP-type peptidyl-prolyl cis-trans isomerase [Bacteroidetes bacterium]|nr:FKBP-type peptidyl-prolyl cis-trans isomerase [Bacteroidota bacterium]